MSYISMDDLRPGLKDTIMEAYNQLKLTVIDEDFFFEPGYKDRGFYIVRANPEGTESLLPTRNEFFGVVSAGPFNDDIVYRTYIVVDHETGNMYTKSQTYEAPNELLRETEWLNLGAVTGVVDNLVDGGSTKALSAEQGKVLHELIKEISLTPGENGKSAYDIAKELDDSIGTPEEWIASLKGEDGIIGKDGKSSYELAVDNGFVGTIQEYLESLKGKSLIPTEVIPSDGTNEPPLIDNYKKDDIVVKNNKIYYHNGTEFIELGDVGPKGDKGDNGEDGHGLQVKGQFDTIDELPTETETGSFYFVGDDLYFYDEGTYVNKGSLKGVQGEQGEQGSKGEKGDRGERGLTGLIGPIGPQGEKGDKGDKGDTGIDGINGKSAYEVAVENGFIGDELDFITSLRGERGFQGEQGIQGEKGETGAVGPKGETGERGEQGIQGIQGEQGIKGDMGDSFVITKSYNTIAEMEVDFNNVPENSFVIISSDDPDNDPDNAKVYFRNNEEFRFIAIMRGLRGEKGDQGLQGIQGIQGERGEKGEKGDIGERGEKGDKGDKGEDGTVGGAIKIKGVLDNESELPVNGENGDAYWIGTRLYIWTDDLNLLTEPGFFRGNDLQGIVGPQGIQGPRGEKGEGVDDLGVAELLTQNKTIKEAINEVFQYGNDVKEQTVTALLSKDNTLPIDNYSTWEEVTSAINSLTLNKSLVNGVKFNKFEFKKNPLNDGDYVKLLNGGLVTTGALLAGLTPTSNILEDAIAVGEDRILFTQSYSNNGNLYVRMAKVTDDNISQYNNLSNSFTGTGDYSKLCLIDESHAIVAFSLSGTNALNIRLVKINDTSIAYPIAGISISTINYSGQGFDLIPMGNKRFIISHLENNLQSVSVYEVDTNTTNLNNAYKLIAKTSVANDSTGSSQIMELSKDDNSFDFIVTYCDSENNLKYTLASFDNVSSQIIIKRIPENFVTDGELNGEYGVHHRINKFYNSNGDIIVSFFYNNPYLGNSLMYGEIAIDKSNLQVIENSKYTKQLLTEEGSGRYTARNVNKNLNNHKGIKLNDSTLMFTWINNLNEIKSAIFEYDTKELINPLVLRSGVNLVQQFNIGMTNNNKFMLGVSNSAISNNTRSRVYYACRPIEYVTLANRNDKIYGVVTNSKVDGINVEVTIPFE